MSYNRDEVRKLEREIEETSGNRFRPYRVGGGTVSEDLVVRIAEKWEKAWEDEELVASVVIESAIREALLLYVECIRGLLGEQDPVILAKALLEIAPDAGLGKPPRKYPLTATDVVIVEAARLLREAAREEAER